MNTENVFEQIADITRPADLSHLTEFAQRSFNNISFSPERRGTDTIREYTEQLNDDIVKIQSLGANSEQIERYKTWFEGLLRNWLGSQSNTASSFICGPSNFPSARMQKRHQWADNHYHRFQEWRNKVISAYEKAERKAKKLALEEKYGGEAGLARKKLENLEKFQETMKIVNNAHKAYIKNPSLETLEAFNLSEDLIQRVINYVPRYSLEPHPFAPYQLTNNGAEIRRMKSRVEELEAKESRKESGESKETIFEGGRVLMNNEIDRIQIFYNEKPAYETIQKLKKNGFHWSPSNKAWQRQITNNAVYATRTIIGLT